MATLNLREQAEADLATTLEGEFALPVVLVSPGDGITQNVNGQVLYDTVKFNPDTGEQVVVPDPVVVLRLSSLSRIPKAGETWHVKIPSTPSRTAPLKDFVYSSDKPPEGGESLGIIRLYLQKASQLL